MPLTISNEEYQGFKTIIGELLRAIDTSETTLMLSAKLTALYDILDKRLLAAPMPLGDQTAFPVGIFPGMTYRQYLIAQVLPEAMRYSKRLPTSGNPGESSAFFQEVSDIASLQADAVLLLLETEKQMAKDDDAMKEKGDGKAS